MTEEQASVATERVQKMALLKVDLQGWGGFLAFLGVVGGIVFAIVAFMASTVTRDELTSFVLTTSGIAFALIAVGSLVGGLWARVLCRWMVAMLPPT